MAKVIQQLRDLVPLRPLGLIEAMRVAELQANRLLALSGIEEPLVPDTVITKLPRVQVERLTPSPVSGAVQWTRGRWLIVVNGAEPVGAQRFSLAHELKHLLDDRFIRLLYPPAEGFTRHERGELACDYFAACLLMPRAWVKQHYCDEDVQELSRLARRFGVTRTAMQARLQQLGLVQPTPQCRGVAKVAA